jgi:hypothetical protein
MTMSRFAFVLILLGACCDPITPSVCNSSNRPQAGSQCCLWDAAGPCGDGLTCHWEGGKDQNSGICREDAVSPIDFYTKCEADNSCYPGGTCYEGTCRILCIPGMDRVYCGSDVPCAPITVDGSVGVCAPKSLYPT